MEDKKMAYKTVKFTITAKAEYVPEPAPEGTKSLSCVANEIYNTAINKKQLKNMFGGTFYDKSYLRGLSFEDGVADEIED